jgi:hypothetical protein
MSPIRLARFIASLAVLLRCLSSARSVSQSLFAELITKVNSETICTRAARGDSEDKKWTRMAGLLKRSREIRAMMS